MKIMNYLILIMICFSGLLFAGEKKPGEVEEWMKQAMIKERQRAEEASKHHANAERFEQKYGWAKEKNPELFAKMMTSNKKAAEAWAAVARKGESTSNPEALSELKLVANSASAEAYQAEMALKYATAKAERRHMVEKSGSAEVGEIAAQIEANEKALLQAQKAKDDAIASAEKLQNENRALNTALHEAYKKAREAKNQDELPKKNEKDQDKKK